VGQSIELTVGTYPGKVFTGTVASLDARVSQETRTLLTRGTLANPERTLLPGMFANVAVLAGAPSKVVTVPRTAVTYSLYGDSVYVLKKLEGQPAPAKPEDTVYIVERRFVKSGQVREDRVVIAAGLKEGAKAAGIESGMHKVAEVVFGCMVGLVVSWLMSKVWLVKPPVEAAELAEPQVTEAKPVAELKV